jgi:hypothetical protein
MTDAADPAASPTPSIDDRSEEHPAGGAGVPGPPRDDIQRPLDESVPADVRMDADAEAEMEAEAEAEVPAEPAVAEPDAASVAVEPVPLRPAVPADEPTRERAEPAEPEPAVVAAAVAVAVAEPTINLDAPPALVAHHVRRGLPLRVVRAIGRPPTRAGAAVAAWAGRPAGRLVMPGAVIMALLAATVATGAFVIPDTVGTAAEAPPPAGASPGFGFPTDAVPGGEAPGGQAPPPVGGGVEPGTGPGTGTDPNQGYPQETLTGWAEQMSALTGIPMIAVRAYGYAELVLASAVPTCHLSWTTLAAIGRVESNHGSSGGATLLADGRALPAIIGLPLDGQGDRQRIPDTDGGELDGDQTFDRAVGPMQFIPSTWRTEAAPFRGIADVHNINDASLAAGYYLCRGRDLATPDGWWAAILSYNNVQSYASAVFTTANQYGLQSRGGVG